MSVLYFCKLVKFDHFNTDFYFPNKILLRSLHTKLTGGSGLYTQPPTLGPREKLGFKEPRQSEESEAFSNKEARQEVLTVKGAEPQHTGVPGSAVPYFHCFPINGRTPPIISNTSTTAFSPTPPPPLMSRHHDSTVTSRSKCPFFKLDLHPCLKSREGCKCPGCLHVKRCENV